MGKQHLGGHVAEDGRLEEIGAEIWEGMTASEERGAFGGSVLDVRGYFLEGAVVDQGPVRYTIFVPWPDFEGAGDGLGELLTKRVVDAGLDVDPVGAYASLAAGSELGCDCSGDRGVEVGVIEHDKGSVAAEFEGEFLEGWRGLLHEEFAHWGTTREGNFADFGGGSECFARLGGVFQGGHDVYDALGESGAVGEFGEGERCEGGFAGGFGHDGAACGEGGADFPGDHGGGEVPGGDEPADSDGFFDSEDPVSGDRGRHGVACCAAGGFFSEPFEEGGRVGDFPLGVRERFAVLEGDELGEIGGVVEH